MIVTRCYPVFIFAQYTIDDASLQYYKSLVYIYLHLLKQSG